MSNELLYHFFDDDDFLLISNKIKETEKVTSGEIRVALKESVPFFKKKKDIGKLAQEEFYNLRMYETRDKTGILIYILLNYIGKFGFVNVVISRLSVGHSNCVRIKSISFIYRF